MSGTPQPAIFVNTEILIVACAFSPYLKAAKANEAMDSFEYPIYKLKIAYKRKGVIDSTCMAEFKITETVDVFCVDEAHNRIIVPSKAISNNRCPNNNYQKSIYSLSLSLPLYNK